LRLIIEGVQAKVQIAREGRRVAEGNGPAGDLDSRTLLPIDVLPENVTSQGTDATGLGDGRKYTVVSLCH